MNMGKINKCNLKGYKLSRSCKKYQCLYDKNFPGYGAIYTCQSGVFCIHFVKEINLKGLLHTTIFWKYTVLFNILERTSSVTW